MYKAACKIAIVLFLPLILYTQDSRKPVNSTLSTETSSINSLNSVEPISIIKSKEQLSEPEYEIGLYEFQLWSNQSIKKNLPKLDVVSSFRNNIRFGGFWDKYTIINITPQVHITPADFISIYAAHNMSYFVPIEKVKQNFKSMVLRGTAVIAVENTVRLLFSESRLIGPLLGFLAKNILIYAINSIERTADINNNLLNSDFHYYSITIRF